MCGMSYIICISLIECVCFLFSTLDDAELLHLQCMLFLPTVNEHQMPNNDADYRRLFDVDDAGLPPGRIDRHAIRAELLRRPVRDDLLVSKEQFLSVS